MNNSKPLKMDEDTLLKKLYKQNFFEKWYYNQKIRSSTLEEYLSLPHSKRHFFGWIYRPFDIYESIEATQYNWFSIVEQNIMARKNFIRNNYPIQYLLREVFVYKCEKIKIQLNVWCEKIKNFISPNQKWLYKRLPKYWIESDELIERVLFEIVKHYIEDQEALQIVYFGDAEKNEELLECYNFITKGVKKLDEEYNVELKAINSRGDENFEGKYDKLNAIEEDILQKKKHYMHWIVENRELFWV